MSGGDKSYEEKIKQGEEMNQNTGRGCLSITFYAIFFTYSENAHFNF